MVASLPSAQRQGQSLAEMVKPGPPTDWGPGSLHGLGSIMQVAGIDWLFSKGVKTRFLMIFVVKMAPCRHFCTQERGLMGSGTQPGHQKFPSKDTPSAEGASIGGSV